MWQPLKCIPNYVILAGVALLVFVTQKETASASGLITISDTAPTENILIESGPVRGEGSTRYSDTQYGGIIFKTDQAIELESATFYLHAVTAGMEGTGIYVSVVEFDAFPPTGTVNSPDPAPYSYNVLYTDTSMLFPAGVEVEKYITFTLDSSVTLDAGKVYGILFEPQSKAFNFRSSDYNDPDMLSFRTTYSGGTPTQYLVGSQEFYVALQGLVVVPEPATVVALMGGIGLLGILYWRRRV